MYQGRVNRGICTVVVLDKTERHVDGAAYRDIYLPIRAAKRLPQTSSAY